MDAAIKEILKKKSEAQAVLVKCDTAIEAMQQLCEHDWECLGHSHNDNMYECTKCGKTDSW